MYSLSVPKENKQDTKQNINTEMQRLMDTYGNDVLRTAYMFLKDVHKSEDAFQEVFIKVYKKYAGFKGESSEKTWIIRITINVCKDMLRSSWLKRVLVTDKFKEQAAAPDIAGRIIRKDENRLLFDEVMSLPESYREAVILFYYHGFDTKEAGQMLNVAEGTVRSRLHRAREMLKERLEGRLDTDE